MKQIWSEKDLKQIKHFLNRINVNVDLANKKVVSTKHISSIHCGNFNLETTSDIINNLLFNTEKEEILRINNLLKPIKIAVKDNQKNPLFFGMLSNLAELDEENPTSIFGILKEIISQYFGLIIRGTDEYCKFKGIYTSEELVSEMRKIKTSTEITEIENWCKSNVWSTFCLTNNIVQEEVFKPIITELDNKTKKIILNKLDDKLLSIKRREMIQEKNSTTTIGKVRYLKYLKK